MKLMQGFLISGFGAGLLFFFPLGLLDNAAYTVFVLFRGEQKNSTKALLFGTLIISAISFSIAVLLFATEAVALIFQDPLNLSDILPFATVLIWPWYFVLIPQFIIRKILAKYDSGTLPKRRLKMIVLRIVLTVVLPAGQYLVHGVVGIVFGLPSD